MDRGMMSWWRQKRRKHKKKRMKRRTVRYIGGNMLKGRNQKSRGIIEDEEKEERGKRVMR